MMGLAPMAVPISWIVSYSLRYLFFAFVFSVLLTKNLLVEGIFDVDMSLMFSLFAAFGINSTCFSYMTAQCFDKSVSAGVLG